MVWWFTCVWMFTCDRRLAAVILLLPIPLEAGREFHHPKPHKTLCHQYWFHNKSQETSWAEPSAVAEYKRRADADTAEVGGMEPCLGCAEATPRRLPRQQDARLTPFHMRCVWAVLKPPPGGYHGNKMHA